MEEELSWATHLFLKLYFQSWKYGKWNMAHLLVNFDWFASTLFQSYKSHGATYMNPSWLCDSRGTNWRRDLFSALTVTNFLKIYHLCKQPIIQFSLSNDHICFALVPFVVSVFEYSCICICVCICICIFLYLCLFLCGTTDQWSASPPALVAWVASTQKLLSLLSQPKDTVHTALLSFCHRFH